MVTIIKSVAQMRPKTGDSRETGIKHDLPEQYAASPEVQKWYRTLEPAIATLVQLSFDMAVLISEYRQTKLNIVSSNTYTLQAQTKKMAELNSAALGTVGKIQDKFNATTQSLRGKLADAQALPKEDEADTQKAILRTLKQQAAWSRYFRRFDAVSENKHWEVLSSIIAEVVANQDWDAYRALNVELPSYMAATSNGWELYERLFNEGLAPLLTDVQNSAALLMEQLEDGGQRLTFSISCVKREINGGDPLIDVLSYYPNESIAPRDITMQSLKTKPTAKYSVYAA